MADFAFTVAEKVIENIGSLVSDEISLARNVRSDLDELKKSVSAIKAVLLDAEEKLLDDSEEKNELRHWVRQLKGIFYDAEDVLDEFVVEDLERQVVSTMGFKRSFKRKVRRFFSSSSPIIFPFQMAKKLKSIRERLDRFAAEKEKFKLVERHGYRPIIHTDRETYSYVYKPDVIGREKDKERVLKLLKQSDGENVSVVSIVGFGGLGKTTLAKLVYNEGGLQDLKFELKIWVCVSEDFDLSTVIAKIIESASTTGEKIIGLNLETLQKKMQDILKDKRYLLVLDDVWNEDHRKWMELKTLLMSGSVGSKILVTTRSDDVANIMGTRDDFKCSLSGLSHKDSVSMFFKHAFPQEDEKQYPKLMEIGEEIVRKCKGVPLAIITLATLLSSTKDMREWESVKENEIWKLEQKKSDILPALKLSYEHLPPHLKRCFAYCSIFPKDYEFTDLQLVQFWIAHGLIVGSSSNNNENEDLEAVGLRYMKELASGCFFQEFKEEYGSVRCKMHDLVHDLALSVMKEEVSPVTSNSQPIAETVRHLYFPDPVTSSLPQNVSLVFNHIDHVRTLSFLTGSNIVLDSKSFLEKCLLQFPYLRALDLQNSEIEELPRMIGTLKHLRYINLLGNSKIKWLPDSICKLHSLQFLMLGECGEIEELPTDIKYLINLRFLWIATKQNCLPKDGIGCLKSLRVLIVRECENLEYLCEDMQGLKSLRMLGIIDCNSLICLPQSVKYLAALETLIIGRCENLSLTVEGKEGTDNDQDKSQLSLRQVALKDLPKLVDLPEWLLRGSHNTLSSLSLLGCESLKELPDWIKNLHSVEKLEIQGCGELSERCKRNTGEDWPKIAHIQHTIVAEETVGEERVDEEADEGRSNQLSSLAKIMKSALLRMCCCVAD